MIGARYPFRTNLNSWKVRSATIERRRWLAVSRFLNIIQGAKSKCYDGLCEGAVQSENMTTRVYLDWNATAPLCPEAHVAVTAALELVGNPSSVHGEGRAARQRLEEARAQVAALVGAEPRNVI